MMAGCDLGGWKVIADDVLKAGCYFLTGDLG